MIADSTTESSAHVYSRQAIAWALFDFATTVFAMNVISRFGPLWIIDEKGGRDFHVMIVIVASLVAATIVNVLLAPLSDEMGRRAVFVRIFGLLCIGATATLGANLPLTTSLAVLALANFANQSVGVFWMAMLGDVSAPRTLGRVSGLAVILSYIGSICGLLVAQPFFRMAGSATGVFVPTALIFLLFALPQFFFVRDAAPRVGIAYSVALGKTWRDLVDVARKVWQNRELRWFMIALLIYMDVHSTGSLYMAVYARRAIGFDPERIVFGLDEISFFFVICTLFAVTGGWIFGQLADRLDKVKLLYVVLISWTVALTVAMLTPVQWPFWSVGGLIGLAMGGVWVLSRALLVEYSAPEDRTRIFTVFGLVGRASGVTAPVTWTLFLWLADQSARLAPHRYRVAIGSLLVEMLIALWMLNKVRKMRVNKPA